MTRAWLPPAISETHSENTTAAGLTAKNPIWIDGIFIGPPLANNQFLRENRPMRRLVGEMAGASARSILRFFSLRITQQEGPQALFRRETDARSLSGCRRVGYNLRA